MFRRVDPQVRSTHFLCLYLTFQANPYICVLFHYISLVSIFTSSDFCFRLLLNLALTFTFSIFLGGPLNHGY